MGTDPLSRSGELLAVVSLASVVFNLIRWQPVMLVVAFCAFFVSLLSWLSGCVRQFRLEKGWPAGAVSAWKNILYGTGAAVLIILSLNSKG